MTGYVGVRKWITPGSIANPAAHPSQTPGYRLFPTSHSDLPIVAPVPHRLSSKRLNYCFQKCPNLPWCRIMLAIKHGRSMMSEWESQRCRHSQRSVPTALSVVPVRFALLLLRLTCVKFCSRLHIAGTLSTFEKNTLVSCVTHA